MKQPAFTCRECLLQYSFSCLYNQPAVFKERYKLSRTCGFSIRTGPSEQGFSPGKLTVLWCGQSFLCCRSESPHLQRRAGYNSGLSLTVRGIQPTHIRYFCFLLGIPHYVHPSSLWAYHPQSRNNAFYPCYVPVLPTREQGRVRSFPQFKILQHIIGNQSHIGCHIDDIDIIFCTAHNRIIKRLSVYMERTVLSRNFFS